MKARRLKREKADDPKVEETKDEWSGEVPVPDYVPTGTARTRPAKRMFLKGFAKHNTNVGIACGIAQINRRTYNRWREEDPEFDAAIEEISQTYCDNLLSLHDKLCITNKDVKQLWRRIQCKSDDPAIRESRTKKVESNVHVAGGLAMETLQTEMPMPAIEEILKKITGGGDRAKVALDKLVTPAVAS